MAQKKTAQKKTARKKTAQKKAARKKITPRKRSTAKRTAKKKSARSRKKTTRTAASAVAAPRASIGAQDLLGGSRGQGGEEFTGAYLVTYEESVGAAQVERMLTRSAGIRSFSRSATDVVGVAAAGDSAVVLEDLSIAVVSMDPTAAGVMTVGVRDASTGILAVEPERYLYALDDREAYLRGYRDAVTSLYESLYGAGEAAAAEVAADSDEATWGLRETDVIGSPFTGKGIGVAVLDTGIDLAHPDFEHRNIVSASFVPDQPVQDLHGHGTHCAGTSCGGPSASGERRYGCAPEANLLVGKVLSNEGSGAESWILAGIQWALAEGAKIISMSLGAAAPPSTAYEVAGSRALERGSLIIAATGNDSNRRFNRVAPVGRPANSPSIMGVAAVDSALDVANFSNGDTGSGQGQVDIAGPGVDVFSTWPSPRNYHTISGTSMATPHVAGIAALWCEARGATDTALWQLLTTTAKRLSDPTADVGAGLVQAPSS